MVSRRKYQSIQDLAGSAELIVPEAPTEDQSAMGKEIASEPKPASIPEPMPKPERENQHDYKNSRTAYPICEEYLHRIRAIAILGEIPITNVINNIFALFFNPDGPLNPTHTAIKSLLTDSNNMLKDYLISNRTTHRK